MKTHTPEENTWVWYCTKLTESLGRKLTDKEVKYTMSQYVLGVDYRKVLESI